MPDLTENYPRVTHPFATTVFQYCYRPTIVRLACLIHAASVRSEPESNSPNKNLTNFLSHILEFKEQKSQRTIFRFTVRRLRRFARDGHTLPCASPLVKPFSRIFLKLDLRPSRPVLEARLWPVPMARIPGPPFPPLDHLPPCRRRFDPVRPCTGLSTQIAIPVVSLCRRCRVTCGLRPAGLFDNPSPKSPRPTERMDRRCSRPPRRTRRCPNPG
jgi:hypothetical protein